MSNRPRTKLGTFLLGPLISLPGQAPMSTTLTTLQLCALFPALNIYMLPSNPLIAILPYNSTTHHGLITILRWTEHQMVHPEATFDAKLGTLIAVHQALSFLGNRPQHENMIALDANIRATMQQELALDDIKEVWALRHLSCTEPWIHLLLVHLAAFCVRVEAKFAHPGLPARMLRNRDLRCETRGDMRVLNWLLGVEGLFERVEGVDGRIDRARLWRLKEDLGEKMVGPFFPGDMGASGVAAAAGAGRMEVIVEEIEEEEMVKEEEDEEMMEEKEDEDMVEEKEDEDMMEQQDEEQEGEKMEVKEVKEVKVEELEEMMARLDVDEAAEDADDEASEGDEKMYFVEDGFASLDKMLLDV